MAPPMVHRQVLVRRPVQAQPKSACPMTRAIERVHEACAEEVATTCQRPEPTAPPPEDPLEAIFGIGRGAGSRARQQQQQMSASDPFAAMRSMMEADPFFRLAATPPSAPASALSPFGSSTLLDELFGGDFGELDRLMDGMMDSALRFGAMASAAAGEGVPMQRTVVRVVNDPSAAAEQPEKEEEAESEAKDDAVEDATPADIAEAALEKMVNSFLGHVVSASASKASQPSQVTEASEDEAVEEEEDDHSQAPRASDGDIQREVLSHDDAPAAATDADVDTDADADSMKAPYGLSGLDPIAMARSIVQRGKAILQEEQEQNKDSEDNDDELRHRRRLTSIEEGDEASDPTVRRRLARRLTEVIPLVGMPTGVTVIPLQDGGLRFLLREQQPRSVPVQHVGPTPRLMLGCGPDNCLWDMFDGRDAAMSSQCADSLSNVRATYSQLVQAEQHKEQEMVTALLNEFGLGGESQTRPLTDTRSDPTVVSPVIFWMWLAFFVLSIYSCLNAGDDDDDEEYAEMPNPGDYVILSDDDVKVSQNSRAKAAEGGVYTGIPVQVV
jgi:hypothetical protein